MIVEVDGETFEVRSNADGSTDDAWLSGPNDGYGFSTGGATASADRHRARIRQFLSMVDPRTGYIEER
ncbi:hypothetical protein [Nocardia thailandica]|uniref:hypothetical protein n=1 Tax=Nocardia thailandica TaxID=257275 RepID=UPI0002D5FF7A|nr:hypothetical protein [Nocardia thailandica]